MTTPVLAADVELETLLSRNAGLAWFGFTSSTGGAAENHDVLAWTHTIGAP